jgi:uncharacterized protein YndB with AHSA1/START domain
VIKKIVIAIVAVIALFLGFAAMQSDSFRIQRSISIKAPPEKIFSILNDFHKWPSWSPYEKLDPQMKRSYSGEPSGKGSIYDWEGNDQVGKGHMEIVESTEPSKVVSKLDFIKPFEAHNFAEFTLVPQSDSTVVTWAMYGPKNYFCKVMHLVVNVDSMCGKDFETGLANLKTVTEK